MNRETIIEKLKEILLFADENSKAAIDNVTDSTDLRTELGFSSVSMLYMVIAIEESFNIRFENVSVSDFVIFGDVVNYIEAKLK